MNARERYIETVLFGKPDKVPLAPGGPRESTLRTWRTQGLPEGANWHPYLMHTLGIRVEDRERQVDLGVTFQMIPKFEEEVLEHRDGHYIVRDWMGAVTEISDEFDYTYIRSARDFVTRKWHKFPVETREEWEEMKSRFDPDAPGRFPDDFRDRCRALADRDHVLSIGFNGPFWQLREWMGFEGLCIAMAEQPDFVREMSEFWREFVAQVLDRILHRVTPDMVMMSEDMGYKEHSMISPRMTREFLLPAYERWIGMLTQAGCPVIGIDSDGHIGDLLPIWIETGINYNWPVEVAAGNDIVSYRRTYKRKMAYGGGIDKRAIAKGGDVMREHVLSIVPALFEDGGYIPGCDHGVPPDISWPNFVEYTRLLAELCGWL
jgi:hypothetical protein